MPEQLLLDIRNIHKSFGMNAVLKGISLKLGEGEVLALIGGNGAGKSTLMKIIMGIYHQDSGEIYVRGEKVTSNKTSAALANGIYMVPQEPLLFPNMTVEENIVIGFDKKASELHTNTKDLGIKIVSGMEGLLEVSVIPESEILVTAIVGMLGIRPTIAAIKAGKKIALANKETLVTAGHIIIPLAKEYKVPILPVDSEHSAIFQSLQGAGDNKISRILLTASGGPFRGRKADELKNIQVEDALKHPNWSMGRKITIDSSTLVNKGLEVMEAKWLFDVALDQIQVVVHPQSVIHSAVEYQDGAVIAQLGTPDMRLPIQYALYYPERRNLSGRRLDLFEIADLTFEKPYTDTFRGLALAYQAMEKGGNIPTVYNAANEKAVSLFLDRKISYPEITELIEACMENAEFIDHPDVDEILGTEAAAYEFIEKKMSAK